MSSACQPKVTAPPLENCGLRLDNGGMPYDGRQLEPIRRLKGLTFNVLAKELAKLRQREKPYSRQNVQKKFRDGKLDTDDWLDLCRILNVDPENPHGANAGPAALQGTKAGWRFLVDGSNQLGPTVVSIMKHLRELPPDELKRVLGYLENLRPVK